MSIYGQNNQTVGAIIQLLFQYDHDRISNVDWEHLINGTFVRVNKDQRGKYEETESDDIYVLKIFKSRKSDAGMYRAHCGGHSYSDTVEVLVGKFMYNVSTKECNFINTCGKFINIREGFFFAKLCSLRSFTKMKNLQSGQMAKSLSGCHLLMLVNHAPVANILRHKYVFLRLSQKEGSQEKNIQCI